MDVPHKLLAGNAVVGQLQYPQTLHVHSRDWAANPVVVASHHDQSWEFRLRQIRQGNDLVVGQVDLLEPQDP